jgi:hypothetical protein
MPSNVDWQADLPKFLVELVEDGLREVGVPFINQVVDSNTLNGNGTIDLPTILPGFFPFTHKVGNATLNIINVRIGGLDTFTNAVLVEPSHPQTFRNSLQLKHLDIDIQGSIVVPLKSGIPFPEAFEIKLSVPGTAIDLEMNVYVPNGYFKKLTLSEFIHPSCLVAGITTAPPLHSLQSLRLSESSVGSWAITTKTFGIHTQLDPLLSSVLSMIMDSYRGVFARILNHFLGPPSAIGGLLFTLIDTKINTKLAEIAKKQKAKCAEVPIININKTLAGYQVDLTNLAFRNLDFGKLVCKYTDKKSDKKAVAVADSGDVFHIALDNFGTNIYSEFSVVKLADNKHAEGDGTFVVQNSRIEFVVNEGATPEATTVTNCTLSFGIMNATFHDAKTSTLPLSQDIDAIVATFGGWSGVDKILGPALTPKICGIIGDMLKKPKSSLFLTAFKGSTACVPDGPTRKPGGLLGLWSPVGPADTGP